MTFCLYVCVSVCLSLSLILSLSPSLFLSLSLYLFLSTPADYMYVPAQEMHDIQEGEQKQISYVLLNPPSDGVFEFAFNVTLSTESSTATGMPETHISCIYSNSPETCSRLMLPQACAPYALYYTVANPFCICIFSPLTLLKIKIGLAACKFYTYISVY